MDSARASLSRVFEYAERLGVERIVMVDGGYPYPWFRFEAGNLLGRRIRVGVLHAVELIDRSLSEGRLKVRRLGNAAWRDSCHLTIRGGLRAEVNRVLRAMGIARGRWFSECCGVENCLIFMLDTYATSLTELLGLERSGDYVHEKVSEVVNRVVSLERREAKNQGVEYVVSASPECVAALRGEVKALNIVEYLVSLAKQ